MLFSTEPDQNMEEMAGIYGLGYSLPEKDNNNQRTVRIAKLVQVKTDLGFQEPKDSNTINARNLLTWIEKKKQEEDKKRAEASGTESRVIVSRPSFILSVSGGASNFLLRRR